MSERRCMCHLPPEVLFEVILGHGRSQCINKC